MSPPLSLSRSLPLPFFQPHSYSCVPCDMCTAFFCMVWDLVVLFLPSQPSLNNPKPQTPKSNSLSLRAPARAASNAGKGLHHLTVLRGFRRRPKSHSMVPLGPWLHPIPKIPGVMQALSSQTHRLWWSSRGNHGDLPRSAASLGASGSHRVLSPFPSLWKTLCRQSKAWTCVCLFITK